MAIAGPPHLATAQASHSLPPCHAPFPFDQETHLASEHDESRSTEYVWIDDILIGVIGGTINSTLTYIHSDALGSPRAASTESGSIKWTWPYLGNPFGEVIPSSSAGDVLNLRFPGQYFDEESRSTYNMHRDYDPATGRFLQSDPKDNFGGQPSTYSYANGNPLSAADPLGLEVFVCRDPAFGGMLPASHYWLKTDTQEVGMATPDAEGDAGNRYDYIGSLVETHTHAGRSSLSGAECRTAIGANEAIVNQLIKPGRPLGRFLPPINYCHSFVHDVLREARGVDPFLPQDPLPIPNSFLQDPYK